MLYSWSVGWSVVRSAAASSSLRIHSTFSHTLANPSYFFVFFLFDFVFHQFSISLRSLCQSNFECSLANHIRSQFAHTNNTFDQQKTKTNKNCSKQNVHTDNRNMNVALCSRCRSEHTILRVFDCGKSTTHAHNFYAKIKTTT